MDTGQFSQVVYEYFKKDECPEMKNNMRGRGGHRPLYSGNLFSHKFQPWMYVHGCFTGCGR